VRLAVSLILLLIAAAPAAAEPVVETADFGSLHAEFSFDREGMEPPIYTNLVLRISNGGKVVRTERVPDGYEPGGFDLPSVAIADYDKDGSPEVRLDVFTGGAHCCLETRMFDGTERFVHEWRDVGYELVERGGLTWFKTADPYFAYAYGAYAYSRFPLQIVRYTDAGFKNVSRAVAWKAEVKADRARLVREYVRVRPRHRGVISQQTLRATLAAAAADDCTLGNCAAGLRRIRTAVKRGEINRYGDKKLGPGASFLHDVRRDLRVAGYLN
jgi:hypothetical protein